MNMENVVTLSQAAKAAKAAVAGSKTFTNKVFVSNEGEVFFFSNPDELDGELGYFLRINNSFHDDGTLAAQAVRVERIVKEDAE